MTVRVDDVLIPEQVIAAEVQYHPAASLEGAREEAARALVVRALLLQEAARLGVGPGDAPPAEDGAEETPEEATIRALLAREVRTPEADEATCRRWYDNNRKRFRSEDLVEAAHILFAARPDDPQALAAARARAEDALAVLSAEPARFAELARALSDCPSRGQGGSLGQIGKGQTVEEFESFLATLEDGQLCPVPARTRFGYHLIRLERRIPGRELPFELVRERIAGRLEAQTWRRGVAQYVKILAGRARIEGVTLEAASSPLVQ